MAIFSSDFFFKFFFKSLNHKSKELQNSLSLKKLRKKETKWNLIISNSPEIYKVIFSCFFYYKLGLLLKY